MKQLKWIAAGGLLGLLAASAFLDFGFEEQYRSTAAIRVAPGMLAERYLGKNFEPQQLRKIVEHHAPSLLSRSTLVGMITTYDLYSTQIKRKPIEDLIEDMRSNIKLYIPNNESLQISFTHPNRFVAQKIVNQLVSRIFEEETRFKLQSLANTVDLLKEESDVAKNEWIKAEDVMRKSQTAGQMNGRLMLDIDMAHDRYKASRNELAEVEKALIVVGRKMGPMLELVDPASMPLTPQKSVLLVLASGLAAGAIAGFAAGRILAFLEKKPEPALA